MILWLIVITYTIYACIVIWNIQIAIEDLLYEGFGV